jgi:cellulose synthase operon protein C
MRSLALLSARATVVAALSASLLTLGCGSTTTNLGDPNVPRNEGLVTAKEVPDAEFAAGLHRLIKDGTPSPERSGMLIGVVRRQLAHAQQRFAAGHDGSGTASVIGALYLLRPGEGRKEMIDATGERALAAAIDRVSPRGDEGRALALMKMRAAALDPASPARVELDQHLAALTQWMAETRTGGPMRRLGTEERARVARALVDPSEQTLEEAASAINAWIGGAIQFNDEYRQGLKRPEREEAVEAQRALSSGGATMASIFLRSGDAGAALQHLDQSNAKHVILPGLIARVRGAAASEGGTGARDWLTLAATFGHQDPDEADPETDIDPELLIAGLWGSAIEAYRRDPASFDAGLLVARVLTRFGMPEAAPLVVSEGLAAHTSLPAVRAATELLLSAIGDSAEIDDLEAARRTFASGAAILAIADRPEFRGQLETSPARVRAVMASIEIRSGNLAGARPLLQAALAAEPSTSGYTMLSMVERQAGNTAAALAAVEQALRAPDTRVALLDVAEAHLTAFELFRDGASADKAKPALDAALSAVLAGRQAGGSPAFKARAERLLGRVLESYGESSRATKAYERALQLAASDRPTLGAAMLDAIGRALVQKDLAAARGALKKGLDGDASEDDLVYGGLWVQLLERELHAPGDGTVERALRTVNKATWTAKLTAWANGKLSDTDLSTAARSASQKVEAAFYTAMSRRVSGDPAAETRLRAVATSPVVDLLEVHLAREILAPHGRVSLPGGVQLP